MFIPRSGFSVSFSQGTERFKGRAQVDGFLDLNIEMALKPEEGFLAFFFSHPFFLSRWEEFPSPLVIVSKEVRKEEFPKMEMEPPFSLTGEGKRGYLVWKQGGRHDCLRSGH